jgi:hypothetical protein
MLSLKLKAASRSIGMPREAMGILPSAMPD